VADAELAISRGFAEFVAGTGVTVNALLPGPTRSEGVADFFGRLAKERGMSEEEMGGTVHRQEPPDLAAASARDAGGNTPGHIAVNISSGGEELLLTGDVVVNSAVSFLHPEWPFGFDIDVPLATKTRMAFLDRAAADKTLVGSYHLPFPGFGHVVREKSAYRWLPADWRWTS
jgi:glyoxylase-like metal-dependent hydrolase (beta-lactamase superfamily II)